MKDMLTAVSFFLTLFWSLVGLPFSSSQYGFLTSKVNVSRGGVVGGVGVATAGLVDVEDGR